MVVGEYRNEIPTMDCEALMRDRGAQRGQVVYIHPQQRFYVVEFSVAGRTYRESFDFLKIDKNEKRKNERKKAP